jgi:hypothetical protein
MLAEISHERSQALLRQRNLFALASAGLGIALALTGGLAATRNREVVLVPTNAGQEKAERDDDLGFVMGRIHASGRIGASGLAVDLEWSVIGSGFLDMSENELEIWYGAQDRLTVMLKPPGANEWITVKPCEFVENRRLPSGTTVSVYNELYHPTNGANYAAIYLSPNLDRQNPRGVAPGIWTVRLVGDEIRDGRFNCWIERDDLIDVGSYKGVRLMRFPSFFSEKSNVDSHSISSLACGQRVIAVANLDEVRQRINISSSLCAAFSIFGGLGEFIVREWRKSAKACERCSQPWWARFQHTHRIRRSLGSGTRRLGLEPSWMPRYSRRRSSRLRPAQSRMARRGQRLRARPQAPTHLTNANSLSVISGRLKYALALVDSNRLSPVRLNWGSRRLAICSQ